MRFRTSNIILDEIECKPLEKTASNESDNITEESDEKIREYQRKILKDDCQTKIVIRNIQKMCPVKGEYIVVTYDMRNLSIEKLNDIHNMIKFSFPNNHIIALPNEASIKVCDGRVLDIYIDNIRKIQNDETRFYKVGDK